MMRNSHVQTLAGAYVFSSFPDRQSVPQLTSSIVEVSLADGDRLVYHDDCPIDWQPGDRIAILLHGLSGSYISPYMIRTARQFVRKNVRAVRVDWRGSGAGMALARYPYHSGRAADLQAVIDNLNSLYPTSPLGVVGYSMGGNILLKMLGESISPITSKQAVTRAVAVCPPIDLTVTIEFLRHGLARWYDHYFAKACIRDVRRRQLVCPEAVIPDGWFQRPPQTLREFDDSFTAPVCGFDSAADYYLKSSAKQFLPGIEQPTLIIAAQDDPVVPFTPYHDAQLSSTTKLLGPRYGGHVGFVTTKGASWLDRHVVDWVTRDY